MTILGSDILIYKKCKMTAGKSPCNKRRPAGYISDYQHKIRILDGFISVAGGGGFSLKHLSRYQPHKITKRLRVTSEEGPRPTLPD